MDKIILTEKEYEIMTILWKNKKPLLASYIGKSSNNISSNSVHHLLNNLMRKGLVKVAGSIRVVKSQSRLYAPAMSIVEYFTIQSIQMFKETSNKFDLKSYLYCLTNANPDNSSEMLKEIKDFIIEFENKNNNNN